MFASVAASAAPRLHILICMNRESSEAQLEAVKEILKDFVERYEILGEHEREELKHHARKELGHIEGVIAYVHSAESA
jgi:hypothetical protein